MPLPYPSLQGTRDNVEDWERILRVHSLVLKPQEHVNALVRYTSICRKSGRMVHASTCCGACFHLLWGMLPPAVGHASTCCGACFHLLWGMLPSAVGHASTCCGSCFHLLWGMLPPVVGHVGSLTARSCSLGHVPPHPGPAPWL